MTDERKELIAYWSAFQDTMGSGNARRTVAMLKADGERIKKFERTIKQIVYDLPLRTPNLDAPYLCSHEISLEDDCLRCVEVALEQALGEENQDD